MMTRTSMHAIAGNCLFILSCCCGCGSEQAGDKEAAAKDNPVEKKEQQVTLRAVDGEGLQTEIAKHKGNVVLIDFWATWCQPCVKQFPHTVELSKKLGPKGLTVISLSMDQPESEEEILSFLKKEKATFVNFVSRFGAGSQSVEEFDLRGDVPLYRLYGRSGKLRFQFSADPEGLENGEPLENLDKRTSELLAENAKD